MIKFRKVSYEQFAKDSIALGLTPTKEIYDAIKLPKRATVNSAGYDFYAPYPISLKSSAPLLVNAVGYAGLARFDAYIPNTYIIPTGIRVELDPDKFLMAAPKSGHGFRTGTSLANTIGIVDADYFTSSNEGHILLKLVAGFDDFKVNAGESVMQGVILSYFTETGEKPVTTIRDGGFGSTAETPKKSKSKKKE